MSKIGDIVDITSKLHTSGFTSCKACGDAMPIHYVDKETKEIEDDVCSHCQRAAADAISQDQYYYEGLWWDMHWNGKDEWEKANA